jgi:hypothetical protein
MHIHPVFWALLAPPVWLGLALAPANLGVGLGLGERGALAATLVVSVAALALVLAIDRRGSRGRRFVDEDEVNPEDGAIVEVDAEAPAPRGWGIAHPIVPPAAVAAGIGVFILLNEIGNGLEMLAPPVVPERPPQADDPVLKALGFGLLGVIAPICWTIVCCGISLRAILGRMRLRTALVLTALWGGMMYPLPGLYTVGALLLGAFVYAATRSLPSAVLAVLPTFAGLLAFELYEVGPGIVGFDVEPPDGRVVWQPIWLDLLGGALVAAGVGAIMKRFEDRIFTHRAPEPQ